MIKHVIVTIEGLQPGTDETPIVLTYNGTCHLHNDKYYVQYDEIPEDGGSIKNMIKFSQTQLEMTKKGSGDSQLSFDLEKDTQAIYRTPYGSLCFDIQTSDIRLNESEEQIEVKLKYSLYTEGASLSDHITAIRIVPDRITKEEV